jgi:hypothetical protein
MYRLHSFTASGAVPEVRGIIPCIWAASLCVLAACDRDAASSATGPRIRVLDVPAASGSGQPFVASSPDGRVVLSWLEPAGDGIGLRYATLDDGEWSAAHTIAQGNDLFVNWADVPSVVPITADVWVAHWLQLFPDSFGAYDIVAATSQDAGATWSTPVLLNDDGTETEHGFATSFPFGDAIGVLWLDGRQLAEWSFDRPDELLGTSLRYARLAFDGGVIERGEIDSLVCDCCQTDVAMASSGPIVVYRDRTEAEIRDVVVRRHDGEHWLPEVALGEERWLIEGCPVNGPAVAAQGDDVAAAWFTAADDRPRVRFARSDDGGSTFGAPVEIDAEGAFGQVAVALLDDATAVVGWWRQASAGRTALAARTVARDGALGPIHTIAESATAQPLDVPEMVRAGDELVFTWTGLEDGGRVMSALVSGLR